jgi:hypothetical protein
VAVSIDLKQLNVRDLLTIWANAMSDPLARGLIRTTSGASGGGVLVDNTRQFGMCCCTVAPPDRLPDAVKYSVRFAKQVVLPARAGLYVDRLSDGWELTSRTYEGRPASKGTVRFLS